MIAKKIANMNVNLSIKMIVKKNTNKSANLSIKMIANTTINQIAKKNVIKNIDPIVRIFIDNYLIIIS